MNWQDNPLARFVVEQVSASALIENGRVPFTMLVHFTLLPEAYGSGPALASVSQEQSRSESGCLFYTWMQHTERPDRLSLYERWCNLDALKLHFGTAHFEELGRMLQTRIAQDPQIELYAEL